MSDERPIETVAAELRRMVDARDTSLFDHGDAQPRGAVTAGHVRLALVEAAARRDLADLLARDARRDVRAWLLAGLELGRRDAITQTEMARLAGVSREAVRLAGLPARND